MAPVNCTGLMFGGLAGSERLASEEATLTCSNALHNLPQFLTLAL
jgi:hypothetical protein